MVFPDTEAGEVGADQSTDGAGGGVLAMGGREEMRVFAFFGFGRSLVHVSFVLFCFNTVVMERRVFTYIWLLFISLEFRIRWL